MRSRGAVNEDRGGDQEHLLQIAISMTWAMFSGSGIGLFWHLPGAELEVDRVGVYPAQTLAQRVVVAAPAAS